VTRNALDEGSGKFLDEYNISHIFIVLKDDVC